MRYDTFQVVCLWALVTVKCVLFCRHVEYPFTIIFIWVNYTHHTHAVEHYFKDNELIFLVGKDNKLVVRQSVSCTNIGHRLSDYSLYLREWMTCSIRRKGRNKSSLDIHQQVILSLTVCESPSRLISVNSLNRIETTSTTHSTRPFPGRYLQIIFNDTYLNKESSRIFLV